MKQTVIVFALLVVLAVAAQAQRPSIYVGVGVPAAPAVVYRPAYPAMYGPGYPVAAYGRCGPACQRQRWLAHERWERMQFREHQRHERERFWRRDMCARGYRGYCRW
jgi:hypothetical protein